MLTYGVVMLAIGPLPAQLGALHRPGEDLACAVGAVVLDDGVDRLEPLAGLDGVDVGAGAV